MSVYPSQTRVLSLASVFVNSMPIVREDIKPVKERSRCCQVFTAQYKVSLSHGIFELKHYDVD